MEKYSGVKIIEAERMTVKEAEEKLGKKIKSMDEPGYFIKDPDGFNTWIAKYEFELNYRQLNGLSFALALDAMVKGERVTRASWENKELWLQVIKAVQGLSPDFVKPDTPFVLPFIGKRLEGNTFIPWTPSQEDMFAGDYVLLPPKKKPKQPGSH